MADVLLFAAVTMSLVNLLAPCVFEHFDRRLARRLLSPSVVAPRQVHTRQPRVKAPATETDLAGKCDALARLTRSGMPTREALERVLGPAPPSRGAQDQHVQPASVVDFVQAHQAAGTSTVVHACTLILAALVDGNFEPSALDLAAATLRDRAACSADVKVALAQTRLSATVLTRLPLIALCGLFLVSPRFRGILGSPSLIVILVAGLLLNWIGRRWMNSLITRAQVTDSASLESIVDHLCVSLRAGYSLSQACERLADTGSCGESISTNLQRGELFETALSPLATEFGVAGRAIVDVLLAAQRDGQPVLSTIDRLATDNRMARRRDTDTRIRQLPGKLSAPLVLFILPSFMLLSVAPLVLTSIGRITQILPTAGQ